MPVAPAAEFGVGTKIFAWPLENRQGSAVSVYRNESPFRSHLIMTDQFKLHLNGSWAMPRTEIVSVRSYATGGGSS
jgi:hypothetical protein